VEAFPNPFAALFGSATQQQPQARRADGWGPAVSYCVRLCDGRYFPMQRHGGATPIEMCNAFCPAAKVKVFAGTVIEQAVANDGTHYADLPTAYSYRKSVAANCTCNGKDAFGLAQVEVKADPTLRPGDVVATVHGLVAYQGSAGGRQRTGNFTPIASYAGLPVDMRQTLLELKVAPAPPSDGQASTPAAPMAALAADDRLAELRLR
jgi:hypothetical protein